MAALTLATALVGCSELLSSPQFFNGDADPPGTGLSGQGVGRSCATQPCRPGLDCEAGICVPGHSLAVGSPCVIGPECESGLACVFGVCVPAGEGELGDACTSDADCTSGLRCGIAGLTTACVLAGTADLGQACIAQSDCFQGLYCASGECSLPEQPFGVPLWKGVECKEPDDSQVAALFSVPGAPGTPADADFFQLPYPNDIRLGDDGRPELADFPTPGPELLGVDLIAAYARAVEKYTRGFGTAPSVVFRFSGAIDSETLASSEGEPARIVVVDLDDPTGTPNRLGYQWSVGSSRTKYVCDDWLAIGLGTGGTLVPGHRHAVWITRGVESAEGKSVARSPSFAAMLKASAPSDASLKRAHGRYAPLRAYLTQHAVDPDTLLVATVFTTDDALGPMRDLAEEVEAAPLPTASEWTLCGEGVESPCSQREGERACGEGTADYEEYHALIELPIFQEGEPPYLGSGGRIRGSVQRTEEVCLSLTVPRGTMPASGWPLVVYAHGTGGSMRSHVVDAIAGRLSRTTSRFAVLGIDQVQHGPRRGASDEDPEQLFFNFTNPDAARGNPLQGAADQLSLLRWASALNVDAATTGGRDVLVDPARVFLYGHSQGGTHGSLALPFSDYPGAVLSGNGGALALALLHKTSPQNIASGIPLALQDPDSSGRLAMGVLNPALNLLQHYLDAGDPLTFAPLVAERPEPGRTPKHVFETFGLGDTYSPPQTLASYVHATGVMMLAPPPDGVEPSGADVLRLSASRISASPVSGNFGAPPGHTIVTRQYAPGSGRDGHHVTFHVPEAIDDVVGFLSALGEGATPTVPAP